MFPRSQTLSQIDITFVQQSIRIYIFFLSLMRAHTHLFNVSIFPNFPIWQIEYNSRQNNGDIPKLFILFSKFYIRRQNNLLANEIEICWSIMVPRWCIEGDGDGDGDGDEDDGDDIGRKRFTWIQNRLFYILFR